MKKQVPKILRRRLFSLLLVVISVNTFAVCESERGPYSIESETCWNPNHGIANYRDYSLVDISRGSETLVRLWLENNDSEMVAEFKNIERIFDGNTTLENVGFMLSKEGVVQSDCRLYHIQPETAQSFSAEFALTRIGTSRNCRRMMRRLARAVAATNGPPAPAFLSRLHFGLSNPQPPILTMITDGYEVRSQALDGQAQFDAVHGTDEEVAIEDDWLRDRISELETLNDRHLDYPIATRVVQSGDTLSGIAWESSGDANAWRSIYAFNVAQLSDPNIIELGSTLVLPAIIERWQSVDLTQFDNLRQAAEAIYASDEYMGLILFLCGNTGLPERRVCHLPEFSHVEGFQRIILKPDTDH